MTERGFAGRPGFDVTGDASDAFPFQPRSSFREEERALLWERCRLVFVVGLVAVVVLVGVSRALAGGPWVGAERLLDLAHLSLLAGGLVVLYAVRSRFNAIQYLALAVIALNALVAAFSVGVLPVDPSYDVAVVLSLALFVPAAVIPWRVRHQVVLGFVAVAAAVAAPLVRRLGGAGGAMPLDPRFWEALALAIVPVVILAATSVLVTYTLYNLRRKVHRARRMGSYTIERELGKGGMGEVFVARHARIVRPSAIKVLRASASLDEEALARFEREVQTASRLTHPNTITIYDYGRADHDTFYYAMEFLEGLDLRRLVERFGPTEPGRAAFILSQVCGSLIEAHGQEIVHRDLKPANIFLTHRGGMFDYVKVLDFGLAKQVAADQTVTREGLIVGTPAYMSPEAILGTPVDGRSDIYSLGAVAYFLVTGRPPFEADSAVRLLYEQVQKAPAPPSTLAEFPIPADYDAAVLRCLEKTPEERFQTVDELRESFDRLAVDGSWSTASARAWWELHEEAMRPVPHPSPPSVRTGSRE